MMFQHWRLKIREAAMLLQGGRLDEASRLLRQGGLCEFRPGLKLSAEVAEGMIARAATRAAAGDTTAGWCDLETAAALSGENPHLAEVRELLVVKAICEAERLLATAAPDEAIERLDQLAQRHPLTEPIRTLKRLAGHLAEAERAARRGNFAEAETELSSAIALRPDWPWLHERQQQVRLMVGQARQLGERLHRGLRTEEWNEVLATADSLLEIAPENQLAAAARKRAWAVVGLRTARFDSRTPRALPQHKKIASTHRGTSPSNVSTSVATTPSARYLAWVDAVGGFLVCLGDQIVLGPPSPGEKADVPILADLSRRHAVIRRDGEGYLIESLRDVKINGRPLVGVASLADGNLIELAGAVQIRFCQPHPLSATARLEMVSRHKTEPSADAVLLMADSCILGPSSTSHIVCRHWQHEVVLFRQGAQLACRCDVALAINGRSVPVPVMVVPGAQLAGEDFSFTLEAV